MAYLAAKTKGDSSMPLKRNMREGMYIMGPQVLYAGWDWDCRIRVPDDDPHIRRSIPEATTLECTCDVGAGGKLSPVSDQQWAGQGTEGHLPVLNVS